MKLYVNIFTNIKGHIDPKCKQKYFWLETFFGAIFGVLNHVMKKSSMPNQLFERIFQNFFHVIQYPRNSPQKFFHRKIPKKNHSKYALLNFRLHQHHYRGPKDGTRTR